MLTIAYKIVFWTLIIVLLTTVLFSGNLSAAADDRAVVSADDNNNVGWFEKYQNLSKENKIAFWGLAVPIAACVLAILTGIFLPIILKMRVAKNKKAIPPR